MGIKVSKTCWSICSVESLSVMCCVCVCVCVPLCVCVCVCVVSKRSVIQDIGCMIFTLTSCPVTIHSIAALDSRFKKLASQKVIHAYDWDLIVCYLTLAIIELHLTQCCCNYLDSGYSGWLQAKDHLVFIIMEYLLPTILLVTGWERHWSLQSLLPPVSTIAAWPRLPNGTYTFPNPIQAQKCQRAANQL